MTLKALAWDWEKFKGSAPALKYARRDLPTLEVAMGLTPGRTACIQAGGCLGIFPKYLAAHFQTVYTFEPSLELFPLLCANAPEVNILKYQAALGRPDRPPVSTSQTRRDGKLHRYPHEGITHITDEMGVVPTLTIDGLNLQVCDLIVLDLEGYELEAVLGAEETIRRCGPVLMLEINDNALHYGYNDETIRDEIRGMGYQAVKRIHSDELFVPIERADANG